MFRGLNCRVKNIYQRVNQPLSRRGWTESASKPLADDPVLFAGGGDGEVFHVIYCRLASNALSRGFERPVVAQNYVLREIRLLFSASTDEDQKAMINVLEKSFRGPTTRAVSREVMLLRRNGVSGEPRLKALSRIYDQHSLRDWVDRRSLHDTRRLVPKIVCSEALV